jgi:hypothetical protein
VININYIKDSKSYTGFLPDILLMFNCSEYEMIRLYHEQDFMIITNIKHTRILTSFELVKYDLPNGKFSRLKKYYG